MRVERCISWDHFGIDHGYHFTLLSKGALDDVVVIFRNGFFMKETRYSVAIPNLIITLTYILIMFVVFIVFSTIHPKRTSIQYNYILLTAAHVGRNGE
ncbi:hypothetical protein ASG89_00215 [Paenibacillus sp. Soil766]|nr:hypothetical protein ASG89_00215 [Paenibacillus sp. Soil766]